MSCLGLGIFTLPGISVTFSLVLILNGPSGIGYAIPIYGALSSSAQTISLWMIGFISNIFLWMIPVSAGQFLKEQWALTPVPVREDAGGEDKSA